VHELIETGWLHNHVRMSFASIWCFTLRLPWQLGAAFFYEHLLDACPASNTLGWRWVVGLQTAGKTYLARADLIRDLSGGRFAVDAPLAREATPWPADIIPPPIPPAPAIQADPTARTGLFVTTEDTSLETLALPGAIVALAATADIGGTPAPLKHQVAMAMLADGLQRAATRLGLEPERVDATFGVDAMRDWAARHRLTQIITADAPVGPVKDRLDVLAPALTADGVQLVRLRRAWDNVAWPHAKKGFFPFKAAIPKLLALPATAIA
jgi:deoxyribodipyrimidine photo-lyase